jgi:hypothetical protein
VGADAAAGELPPPRRVLGEGSRRVGRRCPVTREVVGGDRRKHEHPPADIPDPRVGVMRRRPVAAYRVIDEQELLGEALTPSLELGDPPPIRGPRRSSLGGWPTLIAGVGAALIVALFVLAHPQSVPAQRVRVVPIVRPLARHPVRTHSAALLHRSPAARPLARHPVRTHPAALLHHARTAPTSNRVAHRRPAPQPRRITRRRPPQHHPRGRHVTSYVLRGAPSPVAHGGASPRVAPPTAAQEFGFER